MIPKIDREDPRAVSHFKLCNGTEGCKNKLFYVNRFLDKGLDAAEYVESDADFGAWKMLIIK